MQMTGMNFQTRSRL
ncbi:hypothetical protein [uncultured Robinsoniella sp.]